MSLPTVLDLAAAQGFLAAMIERLRDGAPLRIDAAAVETLTLPCIQIILAAARGDVPISIHDPSPAFISAFDDLGLDWAALCGPSLIEADGRSAPCGPSGDTANACADTPAGAPGDQPAGDSAGDVPDPSAPTQEHAVAKRILTVDDSKTIRDMLMLTLADAGFEVLPAVDGQDGLDVLGKERVDVVITDINMPRMDGYELIRQVRRNAAYKTTPILVLTTESEMEKKNLAREAGATGWMVKPFDPDRLIATINKVAP
jgi:two-component system, chemotaxis family, chemotaxis protein CheY